jgi:PEP-CTERM motif
MTTKYSWTPLWALSAILLLGSGAAEAAPILINGSFESGLTAWTVVDQADGSGSWFGQTGTTSPANGFPVAAPPNGSFAAMTDQFGPGSHVLYQDFVVPGEVTNASLSFDYFIQNLSGTFLTPNTLDFTLVENQQTRVDIITTLADPFSVAPADVLFALLAPNANTATYQTFATNLTAFLQAHEGETLRLRFAEVDNQGNFNMGIDAVNLDVNAVPEPTSVTLLGLGLAGLGARRWRQRKAS